MIELKQYEQALEKSNQLISKFNDEQIDFKIKARIYQRKGTIHAKLNQWRDCVKA